MGLRRLARFSGVAVGLAGLLAAAPSAAQPPSPKRGGPGCGRCLAPASTIETVARGLIAGFGKVPGGLVVGSAPVISAEAPRQGGSLEPLREQILRLVVGKLGTEARAVKATDAEDLWAAAEGAPGYVLLMPRIAGGRLVLGADAYAAPRTVWARARQTEPRPVRHAAAQAPLDAEVRAHLAPLSFGAEGPEVTKLSGADPEIHALACGDLDADGLNDVVTVTRNRVLRVKLDRERGQIIRLKEARWEDLAPIAPVPLRQPLGFATIVEGPTPSHRQGHLDVTITDRRGSLRLGPDLEVVAKMESKAVPRQSDAMASMHLVDAEGKGTALVALRQESVLTLYDGQTAQRLARVGAQLAIGDLDQDGEPELVTTVDTLAPKFDAVEVSTARDEKLERRYRLPVPSGVEAVAACPSDGRGPGAVLVATSGEIWELR